MVEKANQVIRCIIQSAAETKSTESSQLFSPSVRKGIICVFVREYVRHFFVGVIIRNYGVQEERIDKEVVWSNVQGHSIHKGEECSLKQWNLH